MAAAGLDDGHVVVVDQATMKVVRRLWLGPYAAAHLDQHSWRHAVLKCLFTQVPVAVVAGLGHRAHGDATLARMLADHAAERTAAGRDVPHDLHRVLALTAQARP